MMSWVMGRFFAAPPREGAWHSLTVRRPGGANCSGSGNVPEDSITSEVQPRHGGYQNEALEALIERDGARAGELLITRFKGSQTFVVDGSWNLARHQELFPEGVCWPVRPCEASWSGDW